MWAAFMSSSKRRIILCWLAAALSAALGVVGGAALYLRFFAEKGDLLALYGVNALQQVFTFALPALLLLAARPGRLQAFRQSCTAPEGASVGFSVLLAGSGTVVISVIASLWAQLLYFAVGYIPEAQDLPQPQNAAQWALAVLAVAVIPALCEELFFRGLIQSLLCRRFDRAGVWIAAVIFAALHFRWEAFPALILVGAVLGMGYLRHGYWSSALLHALYNAVVLLLSSQEIGLSFVLLILCVIACAFSLRGYLGKETADEIDRTGL